MTSKRNADVNGFEHDPPMDMIQGQLKQGLEGLGLGKKHTKFHCPSYDLQDYYMLKFLGKNFSRQCFKIFFSSVSLTIGFDTSCKLSETICLKCQICFQKVFINLTSDEFAYGLLILLL